MAATPRRVERDAEPAATDAAAAKAALERVAIPQEAIDRIAEFYRPGLLADHLRRAPEQGDQPGHRFIVVMSGEPQGGIKSRRRSSYGGDDDRLYRRSPYGYGGPFSSW